MPKRRPRRRHLAGISPLTLSWMLGEMALASVETITRRTSLIVRGRCSPAEANRMVGEKAAALAETVQALASPRTRNNPQALLTPWHRRVTANAKRLRKK